MTNEFYNMTLLEFMRLYPENKTLIYNTYAEKQMCMIRDIISESLLKTPVFVVSVHRSKSCTLPVYAMRLQNGIKVIMRNNFHDWVVSIISPKEINIPEELVYGLNKNKNITKVYCEGFIDEWVFPFNTKNFKNSTFFVNDDFRLFTLLYFLNKENISDDIKVDNFPISVENIRPFKDTLNDYSNRHPNLNGFIDLFPTTFRKITNYEFCENNKLPVFCNDIEDIYNRIIKYNDNYETFLNEKISFDWGEYFKNNSERINKCIAEWMKN